MDIFYKREAVKKLYSSDSWQDKVKNMSDSQVVAIYLRFQREGKL